MPHAILAGVDGSNPLVRSHPQNQTRGNVSAITQNGLIALEMMPETCQSVFLSPQSVIVRAALVEDHPEDDHDQKNHQQGAMRCHSGTSSTLG